MILHPYALRAHLSPRVVLGLLTSKLQFPVVPQTDLSFRPSLHIFFLLFCGSGSILQSLLYAPTALCFSLNSWNCLILCDSRVYCFLVCLPHQIANSLRIEIMLYFSLYPPPSI